MTPNYVTWAQRTRKRFAGREGLIPIEVSMTSSTGKVYKAVRWKNPTDVKRGDKAMSPEQATRAEADEKKHTSEAPAPKKQQWTPDGRRLGPSEPKTAHMKLSPGLLKAGDAAHTQATYGTPAPSAKSKARDALQKAAKAHVEEYIGKGMGTDGMKAAADMHEKEAKTLFGPSQAAHLAVASHFREAANSGDPFKVSDDILSAFKKKPKR